MEIEQLEKDKYKLFKNEEYDEIIKKLYNLHIKLGNKDISTFKEFFDELKNAVELSEKLFEENLKNNVKNFLGIKDILFSKELKKETEEKKNEKEKSLDDLLKAEKDIEKLFHNTEKNIKQMFEKVRFNISKIISSEIQNKSAKLREANKDIESAFEKVKNKIDQLLRELKFSIDTEITNLILEINNRFKQKITRKIY